MNIDYNFSKSKAKFTSPFITIILGIIILMLVIAYINSEIGKAKLKEKNFKNVFQIKNYEKKFGDIDKKIVFERIAYQNKFKHLYSKLPDQYSSEKEKTVYLTFDDGPEKYTNRILKILKNNSIEATFFVVGKNAKKYPELVKKEVLLGHTVGGHSYNHKYEKIYKSVSAFLKDMNKTRLAIKNAGGGEMKIYRFPGGSLNSFNTMVAAPITAEVFRRGYLFYDWNGYVGDADPANSVASIKDWTIRQGTPDRLILLMHDINKNTADSLQWIINYYKKNNYSFAKIENNIKPILLSGVYGVDKKS